MPRPSSNEHIPTIDELQITQPDLPTFVRTLKLPAPAEVVNKPRAPNSRYHHAVLWPFYISLDRFFKNPSRPTVIPLDKLPSELAFKAISTLKTYYYEALKIYFPKHQSPLMRVVPGKREFWLLPNLVNAPTVMPNDKALLPLNRKLPTPTASDFLAYAHLFCHQLESGTISFISPSTELLHTARSYESIHKLPAFVTISIDPAVVTLST